MSSGISTAAVSSVLPSFKPVSGTGAIEKNQEATVYVGNLDEKVTDTILWDLFTQVGVVADVHIPCDRVNQNHYGYAFVELQSEADAEYAAKVMGGVKLYGRPLKVNRASADRKNLDVGANLFVGSLDERVDESMLLECFRAFGNVLSVKVAREGESNTGRSRGFGFVSYDDFEASDAAIEGMNGQYLCNRPIVVNYAFKKDAKAGERHGGAAERLLAAQAKQSGLLAATSALTMPTNAGYRPNMPGMMPGMMPGYSMPPGYPMSPGYPTPPSGYPMPPSGYPMPPSGYPTPPSGYPMPPSGYPMPPPGYPMPSPGYPMPPSGYPMPPPGYPAPPPGSPMSPSGSPMSPSGYPMPPVGYPMPPNMPPPYPPPTPQDSSQPAAYHQHYQSHPPPA